MNKQEFITAVEAKPNFIKWAQTPIVKETVGTIEHHHGRAYISTNDGTQVFNVWFFVDTETGEANWQNQDTLDPDNNANPAKTKALENYLTATFDAFFITKLDLVHNWAEAEVYKLAAGKLSKTTILVFKKGSNPINHLEVVTA